MTGYLVFIKLFAFFAGKESFDLRNKIVCLAKREE